MKDQFNNLVTIQRSQKNISTSLSATSEHIGNFVRYESVVRQFRCRKRTILLPKNNNFVITVAKEQQFCSVRNERSVQ